MTGADDTAPPVYAPVKHVVPDAAQRVLSLAVAGGKANSHEILSPCRLATVVRPRWAMMVALRRAGMSYSAIGRRMRRNHTSVMYAVPRGEAMAARDAEFAALVDRMVAAVVVAPAETQIES